MMLYLTNYLAQFESSFYVFDYITIRAILGALTSLIISMVLGPRMIAKFHSIQLNQPVRDDGPETHKEKVGTPTMGGALIIMSVSLATLMWAEINNPFIWIILFVTISFGILGYIDDYQKIIKNNSDGISASKKLLWQSLIAIIAITLLIKFNTDSNSTSLLIPYLKNTMIELGVLHLIISFFFIIGFSNAVNLTDGLDGLAIMPTVLVAGALGIFSYVTGNINFSTYLEIPYVAGAGEIFVFCAALVGAGLGFLWFNTYPAQVFMGDVGSLSIGASLGVIAVIIKQEIVLVIMGGVFVAETLSVMIQVTSFKLTGKRIFRMAPLHHHYELKGWKEPKIIVRFWIITVILVLIGLASLKIR